MRGPPMLESVARDGITEAECGIAKGSSRGVGWC